MTTTEDIVRRVEDADLAGLRDVEIEDVYTQMEWLLESRATPLDLYKRWERQNWSTQDLDFSKDIEDWSNMTGIFESFKTELQRTFTLFFIGEQAVTDTLSPLLHAAPDEPSRIFLSTQVVDEARHTVFFSEFFENVVGISGGLSEALSQLRDKTVQGFREIFDRDLVDVTERVRRDPSDYGAWVEGIAVYHLVVEGMLALTGQKFLLTTLRTMGILPGFYAGFTAVARDESRHVNYGVRALLEAGIKDRKNLDRVEAVITRLLGPACRTIAAPDRKFTFKPEDVPENLRISPYEVRSFALHSLTKRLKVAGLPQERCDAITKQGNVFFEAAWDEYETRHGVEHPSRFYKRLGAA